MPVNTRIQLRRDTAANWVSAQTTLGSTPILAAGEVGVELDTNKIKVGNGTDIWADLPYISGGGGGGGASITISDTAPLSGSEGEMWFDSTDATLYVYYNDGNTSQWVEVVANSALTDQLGGRVGILESQMITTESDIDVLQTEMNQAQSDIDVLQSQTSSLNNNKISSFNYVINGGFDIWERGTSFDNLIQYTADRWKMTRGTAPTTRTVTRQSLNGAIPELENVKYFLRSTLTTLGSGTSVRVGTHLEDVTTLAGKTVTLSWYAKHNSNASLRVAVAQDFDTTNGGSASVLAMDATFSYTTSWNRYSTTFTMPSVAGKTIATDNFIYIAFYNLSANNSILDITGVQLEEGSVATPFRRNSPSIQAELAACQRYFYNSGLSYSGYGFKYYGGGGNALNDSGYFPSVMRITPSVTVSGTITYTNCSALAYSINNTNFVGRVTVTAAGSYRAIGYNLLFDADY